MLSWRMTLRESNVASSRLRIRQSCSKHPKSSCKERKMRWSAQRPLSLTLVVAKVAWQVPQIGCQLHYVRRSGHYLRRSVSPSTATCSGFCSEGVNEFTAVPAGESFWGAVMSPAVTSNSAPRGFDHNQTVKALQCGGMSLQVDLDQRNFHKMWPGCW